MLQQPPQNPRGVSKPPEDKMNNQEHPQKPQNLVSKRLSVPYSDVPRKNYTKQKEPIDLVENNLTKLYE